MIKKVIHKLQQFSCKNRLNISVIILLILSISLVGCNLSQETQQGLKSYEHIPVKITKIQPQSYLKGMFTVYVEYKSDEYGLTHSVVIGNNQAYAYECYYGQYHIGDTVYAIMCNYKQGDTITKRELGDLDYNRNDDTK